MTDAATIASKLELDDIFVMRRVTDRQLVNLAGVGRGDGWAGNITVDAEFEPLIAEALERPGLVRRSGSLARIFGPFWAEHAALALVGDFIVALGGPGVASRDDATLMDAAGSLAWSAGEVSPEKRLADELEATQAALAVASLPTQTLDGFLTGLAGTAAAALACEFGAVVVREPEHRLLLPDDGWRPDASNEVIRGALLQLLADVESESPIISQDLREDPSARRPLGFDQGLVSRCIIPFSGPVAKGAVVVAHTTDEPRGFTSLCQDVAQRVGEQTAAALDRIGGQGEVLER